jgi:hypothetical protein
VNVLQHLSLEGRDAPVSEEDMDFRNYPRCANGDVLIMLSSDKIFQLHAEMLRRHSKFFRDRLKDGGATLSSNAKRNGETVRWRFDMVERPGFGEDGAGMLERVVSLACCILCYTS